MIQQKPNILLFKLFSTIFIKFFNVIYICLFSQLPPHPTPRPLHHSNRPVGSTAMAMALALFSDSADGSMRGRETTYQIIVIIL